MKTRTRIAALGLAFLALATQANATDIDEVIADPTRPEGASARDEARNPAAVLELSGFPKGTRSLKSHPVAAITRRCCLAWLVKMVTSMR